MSCPVVSVNRALCVLAVVWMMMPVGRGSTPEVKTRPEQPSESSQANRKNTKVTKGR